MSAQGERDLSGFAVIPRALLHDDTVSLRARFIWIACSSYVGGQASLTELGAMIGVPRLQAASVRTDLSDLKAVGWIALAWPQSAEWGLVTLRMAPSPRSSIAGYVQVSA